MSSQPHPQGQANPVAHQPPPTQFIAELPSRWQGGGAASGPVNTQFRHELPTQIPAPVRYSTVPTWTGFAIPTDNDSLTSGFPYQQRLHDLGITRDVWFLFTGEVINAAKLTLSEDYAAWGTGIATGTVSSPFLLVFAPVAGYYAGKSVHKKTTAKRVREKLSEEGELRTVLRRWNGGIFGERGMQVWLEPPSESREIVVEVSPGMKQKDIEKAAKKQARRFSILIMPSKTTNNQMGSLAPQMSNQGGWQSQHPPAAQVGGLPVPHIPNGVPKLQHEVPPGAVHGPGYVTGQMHELPESTNAIPVAFELDAGEATHASKNI